MHHICTPYFKTTFPKMTNEHHVVDLVNSSYQLHCYDFAFQPYIALPNFVDHLTRKPYAYVTCCKCKITRSKLASRETGIKRFRAWTHCWARDRMLSNES